ncbi:hypothetical protein EVAR_87649_1 [Eumeta japonica]|uniref:Uncharacterized protein n=1 Tax=Eumeta variegata TaxID=151549 RepID=A0A4C1WKR0_EUMVA|nr:hypothetical protein EVAR_87649_1 [Eumeta japonica]
MVPSMSRICRKVMLIESSRRSRTITPQQRRTARYSEATLARLFERAAARRPPRAARLPPQWRRSRSCQRPLNVTSANSARRWPRRAARPPAHPTRPPAAAL